MRGWNPFFGTSESGSGIATNSYFKNHEDNRGSFTFRGSKDDELASKNKIKNNVNVVGGGSVSGWLGATNVGSTTDEVNYARNSSYSMACNEQQAYKPS